MEFSISPAGGVPIYQQLADQISRPLPGVGYCPITGSPRWRAVAVAGRQPEHRGTGLYRIGTRGGAVHAARHGGLCRPGPAGSLEEARRERLLKNLDHLLVEAVRLGFAAEELLDLVAERVKQFHWAEAATSAS